MGAGWDIKYDYHHSSPISYIVRRRDIHTKVNLSFLEAIRGLNKKLNVEYTLRFLFS